MVLKQVHDTNMRAKGHPERVFSVSYSSSHSPLQSPLGPFLDAHSHPQTTLQLSGTPRHLSPLRERDAWSGLGKWCVTAQPFSCPQVTHIKTIHQEDELIEIQSDTGTWYQRWGVRALSLGGQVMGD